MMWARGRILIVLFGAIGDVTRALPLLCRLRRAYPQAHLAWAIEPLAAPLLHGHPAVDEHIVFHRHHGIRGFGTLLRRVRHGRFDLVLDLGRLLKSGVTAWATRAPVRIGFHRHNSREGNWVFQTETIPPQAHYSSKLEQYLRFGDRLDLPNGPLEFGLSPTPTERARARTLLEGVPRPFAAFMLGSSCSSRRWFPDRTGDTAQTVWEQHGHAPVLLGTDADRAFAEAVCAAVRVPVLRNLVGQTSLRDALAVLAEAALAVTPDSGAMHMAAAVGVPVVSLWGATSAARSAPHGSSQLTVTGSAACAPCYLRRCPIGRVCMEGIHTADVLARVAAVVETAQGIAR